MSEYKFKIGDLVETGFNSTLNRRVTTWHTITNRFRGTSQSGKLYIVDPPLGGGGGVDEDWFAKVDRK